MSKNSENLDDNDLKNVSGGKLEWLFGEKKETILNVTLGSSVDLQTTAYGHASHAAQILGLSPYKTKKLEKMLFEILSKYNEKQKNCIMNLNVSYNKRFNTLKIESPTFTAYDQI